MTERPLRSDPLKTLDRILKALQALAVGALAAHFAMLVWAERSFTQVEAIVAAHSRMLAQGQGLYWALDSYPYTVSPYGPVFYALQALFDLLEIPAPLGGRLISFAALVGIIWLIRQTLDIYVRSRRASRVGTLLAAATANLAAWGSVGQSDMLALLFSLAALNQYSLHRAERRPRALFRAAIFIALAIFTKQSFLAAGATIVVLLAIESPTKALRFTLALGAAGGALALGLNAFTSGGYFDNAILANLNPYAWDKLFAQLQFLALAGGSLWVIVAVGLGRLVRREARPPVVYLAASLTMFLLTAPKVGSDLNYQIEVFAALALSAGVALDRLDFFGLFARGDKGLIPLLQLPVILHVVLNVLITGSVLIERFAREPVRRREVRELEPYLGPERKRVLSVQIDPLVALGRPIEVEPLIYTLIAEAGLVDPEPVRRDLAERRFDTVILYQNVFAPNEALRQAEIPSLPESHLEAIRRYYRLAAHIDGPVLDGDYVYEPRRSGADPRETVMGAQRRR